MSKPVNFLYFITDQHRADYLGCYGHPVLKTPNIDRIAEGGTRFDRFYVANPVCMPNRATLMTGRMPSAHGARHNGIPLSASANTFVDVLRAAGYQTALIGKSHLQNFTGFPPAIGENPAGKGPLANATRDDGEYDRESPDYWKQYRGPDFPTPYYGFDHVDLVTDHGDRNGGHYAEWLREQRPDAESLQGAKNQLAHDYACPQAVRTALPEELYSTSFIRDRAAAYLERVAGGGKPFFAFVSFPDPHHPFNPPGRYWDLYQPEQMALPPSFQGHKNPPPTLRHVREEYESGKALRTTQATFMVSEREALEAMALTCGMVAMVDDAVGVVMAQLEKAGLAENTVVIFNADHGDFMGDHALMLKGPMHFQGLVRVPFLWKDPAGRAQPASQRLCGTVDVARTILTRAGATPYSGMQGVDIHAVEKGETPLRRGMVIEDESHRVNLGFTTPARLRTLVTGRHRLSVYLDQDWGELYDLQQDPHEMENLWDSAPGVRDELVLTLLNETIRLGNQNPWPPGRA